MLFKKFIEGIESDSKLFDLNMMRIDAYCESAFNEFTINMKEAEFKVFKESGTEDDLDYLFEAAKESYGSKLKKAGQKIVENFKKFVSSITNKIKEFFTKNKKSIDDIGKKINSSPEGKHIKVKVMDKKKIDKVFKQTESKLEKAGEDAKRGKLTKERLNKIVSEHRRALLTISKIWVGAGVAQLYLMHKSNVKDYTEDIRWLEKHCGKDVGNKETQQQVKDFLNKYGTKPLSSVKITTPSGDTNWVTKGAFKNYWEVAAGVKKDKVKMDAEYIKSLWSGIRSAVSKLGSVTKGKPKKPETSKTSNTTTNESFLDDFSDYSFFEESEFVSIFDD